MEAHRRAMRRVLVGHLTKIFVSSGLIALLLVGTLFLYAIPKIRSGLISERYDKIKEMVDLAYHQLEHLQSEVESDTEYHSPATIAHNRFEERQHNLLSDGSDLWNQDIAKEEAKELLRTMRFGSDQKDYFWVNDLSGTLIVHPYRTDLENTNVIDFQDPSGNFLFRDFVRIAQESWSGYITYVWQWKDDPSRIEPKVSYVRLFPPWWWVIGTGVYTNDIEETLAYMTRQVIYVGIGIIVIVILLVAYSTYIGWELLAQDIHHRNFIEKIPIGIFHTTIEGMGSVLYVNPACRKLFGPVISDQELLNLRVTDFYAHAEDRLAFLTILQETGYISGHEVEMRRKDGVHIWVRLTARLVREKNISYINGVVEDITEHRLAVESLAKSYEHLQELDRQKNTFISIVSHELRTPLTSIRGHLSMVQEGDYGAISESLRDAVGIMYRASERLIRFVNDILDLSKLESGKVTLHRSVFSVGELLSEIRFEYERIAKENGISLQAIESDAPLLIDSDRDKLTRILVNLLGNAMKFTPQWGNVIIRVHRTIDRIYISVRDSGIGIAPEDIPRIFETFFQIENVFTREKQGTGLGLPITKHLITEIGGELTVESVVGKYSIFTVDLPALSKETTISPS